MGADRADAIVVYKQATVTGTGTETDPYAYTFNTVKSGEFIITGRNITAVGTEHHRVDFTGHLSKRTVEAEVAAGTTFSLGESGDHVVLHFLEKEEITAFIPHTGLPDTVLGYNTDGEFGEISSVHELPNITYPGLATEIDIVDGFVPDFYFTVWRGERLLTAIMSGVPTADEYRVSATVIPNAGLSFTLAFEADPADAWKVSDVVLDHTKVGNGALRPGIFTFTFLGSGGRTFKVRRVTSFRRIDNGLPETLGSSHETLRVNEDGTGVEWGGQAVPDLGDANQVLTINEGADGIEWHDQIASVRPQGTKHVLIGRASVLNDAGQIRFDSSAAQAYISQELSNPEVDFSDILEKGRSWDLSVGNRFRQYVTTAVSVANFPSFAIVTLNVRLVGEGGSLAIVDGDNVVVTTDRAVIPDFGYAERGDALLVNSAGDGLHWSDAIYTDLNHVLTANRVTITSSNGNDTQIARPTATHAGIMPALGASQEVMAVNVGRTAPAWYDPGYYWRKEIERPQGLTFHTTWRSGSSDPWHTGDNQMWLDNSDTSDIRLEFAQLFSDPSLDWRTNLPIGTTLEIQRQTGDVRWAVVRVTGAPAVAVESTRTVSKYPIDILRQASGGHGAPSNTLYYVITDLALSRDLGTQDQILSMVDGNPAWVDNVVNTHQIVSTYGLPDNTWAYHSGPEIRDTGASETWVDDDEFYGQIIPLLPDPDTEYSFHWARSGSDQTGHVRHGLYLWHQLNNRWERNSTSLGVGNDLEHGNGKARTGVGSTKLSGEHSGRRVEGFAVLSLQCSNDGGFGFASRSGFHTEVRNFCMVKYDVDYDDGAPSVFASSAANTELSGIVLARRPGTNP